MARFGFARAAVDGNVYHSLDPASVYLILEKGTAIVMDGEFEVDGWVWATALVGVEWGSGWMPRTTGVRVVPRRYHYRIFGRTLVCNCAGSLGIQNRWPARALRRKLLGTASWKASLHPGVYIIQRFVQILLNMACLHILGVVQFGLAGNSVCMCTSLLKDRL